MNKSPAVLLAVLLLVVTISTHSVASVQGSALSPPAEHVIEIYHDPASIPTDVVISGKYAYVAEKLASHMGLVVLDITNPAVPVEVGFYPTKYVIPRFVVVPPLAYLTDYTNSALRIIHVGDPKHMYQVGALQLPSNPDGVTVAGGYAYVADFTGGLRVIDVRNPAAPKEVDSYDLPGLAGIVKDVAVRDHFAYVTWTSVDVNDAGIWVFDVTNPASIQLIGEYSTPDLGGDIQAVALSGRYAYLADSFTGLRIIDIFDPAHPVEIAYLPTRGSTKGIVLQQKIAYLLDGIPSENSGMYVVDISIPAFPKEMGFYPVNGWGQGIDVDPARNYTYVANGETGGLYILRYIPQFYLPNLEK